MKIINGIKIIATQEELNYALSVLGEEFTKEELESKIQEFHTNKFNEQALNEAKQYLQETGWIWEKYNRNVLVLKDTTNEEFASKYGDIITKQEESRLLIKELEKVEVTND